MQRLLCNSHFVIIVALLMVIGGVVHFAEATTIGAQNCTTIDTNWKEYNERILGANKKVSDVVLNACAAIGGRDKCRFSSGYRSATHNEKIGGANNSQHVHAAAIDLVVTPGKEVEFITLAICGLRRVNNCQGGIGYYRDKSIHIDVRSNATAVWSTGFKRVNIANNVSDPAARSTLYGFGDGKCTEGSIQGDYSEESIYGPPVIYTPPAGFPQYFNPAAYASFAGQQIGSSLVRSTQNSTVGGGNTQNISSLVFKDETETPSTLLWEDESSSAGVESEQLDLQLGSQQLGEDTNSPDTAGETDPETCVGECQERATSTADTTTQADGVATLIVQKSTRRLAELIPDVLSNNDFFFNDEGEVQRVATSGGSVDVFYGLHSPTKETEQVGTLSQNRNLVNFSQFSAGETHPVVREVPAVIKESARFAELSFLLGSYYGLIHGISPMFVGSTPRVLFRLVQTDTATRVHNPFSI